MNLKKLRINLRDIYNSDAGHNTIYFSDQDCDYYTITNVYMDDDGDICLEAGDGWDYCASDLYDALRCYSGNTYVYIYAPDDDEVFDIEGGWYFDDDGDLTMDMTYSYDDNDDDDW